MPNNDQSSAERNRADRILQQLNDPLSRQRLASYISELDAEAALTRQKHSKTTRVRI